MGSSLSSQRCDVSREEAAGLRLSERAGGKMQFSFGAVTPCGISTLWIGEGRLATREKRVAEDEADGAIGFVSSNVFCFVFFPHAWSFAQELLRREKRMSEKETRCQFFKQMKCLLRFLSFMCRMNGRERDLMEAGDVEV